MKLASTMPDLSVKKIEQRLFAIVLPESNVKNAGERAKIAIAVKNQSTETIDDVFVSISLPEGIALEGASSHNIPLIEAGETVNIAFYVSAQEPGTYRIGCNITYDSVPLACEKVAIVYEAQGINSIIVAGAVLLAIGLAIYMYLYFSSEKKQ